MRRVAASVYVFALAIVVVIALGGYTYVADRQNDKAINALVLERQNDINAFLRDQVCARFGLRDEIVIAILDEARRRALAAGNQELAETYVFFIAAMQNVQGGCIAEIPDVRKE